MAAAFAGMAEFWLHAGFDAVCCIGPWLAVSGSHATNTRTDKYGESGKQDEISADGYEVIVGWDRLSRSISNRRAKSSPQKI